MTLLIWSPFIQILPNAVICSSVGATWLYSELSAGNLQVCPNVFNSSNRVISNLDHDDDLEI
jgi:hypothetical protein